MKKFLGICIGLAMFSVMGSAYAENEIGTELTCNEYGHIFAEDNQTFKLDLQNTLNDTFNGKIQYSIISDGESIYNMEKNVSIAPNGSYTDFPVLSCPEYGIFDLEVKVTDGTAVYGTDTIPFSVINGSAAGEGSEKMFVNTHMEEYVTRTETVNAVSDAGFGGMRNPIYWFTVETDEKNKYKLPDHAQAIKTAAEMGMEPLIVLSGGNGPWGVENEEEKNLNMAPSTDEQIQAFANYCAYVAEQYKGYVKHYEIWNEFTQPSNGGDKSPEAYAKILVAASKAIKKADPDAKIVAMVTAGLDWSFINGVVRKLSLMGESNCYDILSVHPYTYGKDYAGPNTSTLKAIKFLAGSKPIWFTERGWDTAVGTTETNANGISDEVQAVYGVWDYLTLASGNYCERWFWYDFQDDGTNATEREENFGLIESVNAEVPGAAKPAYVAFAALNKLVGRSDYKSVATSGSAKAYCFTDDNGDDTYVLTGNAGDKITVNMAGKLELLDMYSNVVATDDNADGSFDVTLTEQVMYVRKHYEPAGCEVKVSGGELLVSGHSMESDQPVSVMVSSVNGDLIYVAQKTCDDERAYSFTADRKGINELYIKVNYGDVFSTSVETGFVIKLICDGERILSLEDITTTDNVKLVVSVNDAVTTATDVYAAVYNSDALKAAEKITLQPGTATGEYDIDIKLKEITDYDRISGFVWENMKPVTDNVDFE